MRRASSSESSVSVPGVTSRTTSRRTTLLFAALARLGRVLELLAHRDAMAERDQLVQIFVGALDRHAAHRDVAAEMLAAFGQHDAERARGDLGVVEEQFVEVAHPVEQQAIRIGGLDLDILLHHRRDARRPPLSPYRGREPARRRRPRARRPATFRQLRSSLRGGRPLRRTLAEAARGQKRRLCKTARAGRLGSSVRATAAPPARLLFRDDGQSIESRCCGFRDAFSIQ